MGTSEKKRLKAEAKVRKKEAKYGGRVEKVSKAVKFAEGVKGVIYLIVAVSLILALVLSNEGYIFRLEDVIGSLMGVFLGKVIIVVLGIAFFIYGLKKMGLVK